MPPTSTQERPCEVHRDRPIRRLRCADVVDDGRGLARHDRAAPGVGPFRIIALRGKRVAYLHINEGVRPSGSATKTSNACSAGSS
jgi:hypothetical protein